MHSFLIDSDTRLTVCEHKLQIRLVCLILLSQLASHALCDVTSAFFVTVQAGMAYRKI